MMTLSEAEVEKYLDPKELLAGLEDGFRGLELLYKNRSAK